MNQQNYINLHDYELRAQQVLPPDVWAYFNGSAADGLMGRPLLYTLACEGVYGVAHTVKLLRDQFEIAMALCGCKAIRDIDETILILWGRIDRPNHGRLITAPTFLFYATARPHQVPQNKTSRKTPNKRPTS